MDGRDSDGLGVPSGALGRACSFDGREPCPAAADQRAVICVISLAHYAIATARGWAANSINARVRLAAENDRLHREIQLLREETGLVQSRVTLEGG